MRAAFSRGSQSATRGTAVATRTKPWACMSKKDVLPLSGGFGGVPAT